MIRLPVPVIVPLLRTNPPWTRMSPEPKLSVPPGVTWPLLALYPPTVVTLPPPRTRPPLPTVHEPGEAPPAMPLLPTHSEPDRALTALVTVITPEAVCRPRLSVSVWPLLTVTAAPAVTLVKVVGPATLTVMPPNIVEP